MNQRITKNIEARVRRISGVLAGIALMLSSTGALAYAFEIGFSSEYFVMPGGSVTLSYQFKNTGDDTFVFADAGVSCSGSNLWCIDWYGFSVGDNHDTAPFGMNVTFLKQEMKTAHDGLVVEPGETVSFNVATFSVPNLPTESRASFKFSNAYNLSFGESPLSSLYGGLVLGGTNLPGFENPALFDVVLSDQIGNTAPIFYEACIYDRSSGTKVSGPGACRGTAAAAPIPEPGTTALVGLGLLGLVLLRARPLTARTRR